MKEMKLKYPVPPKMHEMPAQMKCPKCSHVFKFPKLAVENGKTIVLCPGCGYRLVK
jgi:transcription elongation factor Elf1